MTDPTAAVNAARQRLRDMADCPDMFDSSKTDPTFAQGALGFALADHDAAVDAYNTAHGLTGDEALKHLDPFGLQPLVIRIPVPGISDEWFKEATS